MQTLAAFFRARQGAARYLAAFGLGAVLTLTMPPIGLFPLALLSVCGFIWMAQSAASVRAALFLGWVYGAGFFITGLYWVSVALFVDIASFGWVLPLSLIVAPTLLALATYAFIPVIAHRFRHDAVLHALVFTIAWAAIEWLRGHLFTGFPWNLAAYMWQHALPVAQVSSLIGAYGLTLLTVMWAALPVMWPCKVTRYSLIALFIAAVVWGSVRLALNPTNIADAPIIRIVQGNVPQTMKWDEDAQWRNLENYALLSDKNNHADAVIWPETALTSDPVLFPEIGTFVAQNMPKDSIGIFGSLRITNATQPQPNYHNGVYVMDSNAAVLAAYDKFHLVPFGEYIPFRDVLQVTPIAAGISKIGDFTAGSGPRTIAVEGKVPPFSPLICYEVIFPGNVTDKNNRPAWLVNVTNDAWYGRSSGPYQHLEITRMRAIEEGLPLARAANTGVSAMIDPLGRMIARIGLNDVGALTVPLPAALPATLYARFGDLPFAVLLLACMGAAAIRRYTRAT